MTSTASGEAMAREVIDALKEIGAAHDGHRAVHAKGTLCAAEFTPTPEAATLSTAAHFRGPPVRAHVRFSNGAGDPDAPDYEPREGRGMAVKFYPPDSPTTDIVALTLPVFFVRDPEGFLEFVRARVPDPATGEPDMNKLGAFLGAHPESLAAAEHVMLSQPPESYLRQAYNSLHSYGFVDAEGTLRFGRYRFEPDAGVASIPTDEAEALGAHYLRDDLAARLAAGPARFTLWVQLAEQDDPVDDPTQAFPEERERVELGTLVVTGLAFDREQDGDILVFDPTRVIDGLELSNDAILRFRADAYAESVKRRTGVSRS
ncbi:MAG: catalase [Actinomycetota bacterium]|jgi:catalase